MKKSPLIFIFLLIGTFSGVAQSYGLTGTITLTDTQILIPGMRAVNFIPFADAEPGQSYDVALNANDTVRFWIMETTEYNIWFGNPSYDPPCIVNVSTSSFTDDDLKFPADGDYCYGLENEGATNINVTVIVIKPNTTEDINGFSIWWVILGFIIILNLIHVKINRFKIVKKAF